MSNKKWIKGIDIDGTLYQAVFVQRPFREGIEVLVPLSSKTLSIAELGLGEQALIEGIKELVRAELKKTNSIKQPGGVLYCDV